MKKYLAFIILVSFITPSVTSACIPSFPHGWFTLENLTLNESTIPQGVDIKVNKKEPWFIPDEDVEIDYSFEIEMTNPNPEPFYLLGKDVWGKDIQYHPNLSNDLHYKKMISENIVYETEIGF
ncbi:hypothetical protein OAC51_09865, partial [Flavobacteriaceae bacterium]|nr:hypothetical protein [Flavobacteriaceae bacterium]